jgi:hypothetical protein
VNLRERCHYPLWTGIGIWTIAAPVAASNHVLCTCRSMVVHVGQSRTATTPPMTKFRNKRGLGDPRSPHEPTGRANARPMINSAICGTPPHPRARHCRCARRPIGAAHAAPPKPRISPSARAAARPDGSSRLRRRELGKARSPHEQHAGLPPLPCVQNWGQSKISPHRLKEK